ncbi:hypothetical protein F5051DRAFT_433012 [Lentinula edodes]|nr:hypothetical protein F5051DRAFT_433012 [Lentinula edodes]
MVVKSSLKLNMFPNAKGVVYWIPMDAVEDDPVLPLLLSKQFKADALPFVPCYTSLEALQAVVDTSGIETEVQAVKIIDFLRDMMRADKRIGLHKLEHMEAVGFPPLVTTDIECISAQIATLSPLGNYDAELWKVIQIAYKYIQKPITQRGIRPPSNQFCFMIASEPKKIVFNDVLSHGMILQNVRVEFQHRDREEDNLNQQPVLSRIHSVRGCFRPMSPERERSSTKDIQIETVEESRGGWLVNLKEFW